MPADMAHDGNGSSFIVAPQGAGRLAEAQLVGLLSKLQDEATRKIVPRTANPDACKVLAENNRVPTLVEDVEEP